MARFADIFIGARFGRLTVTAERIPGAHTVAVRCDCGTEKVVDLFKLGKSSNSCGCLAAESRRVVALRHGMAGTPEYVAWSNMKRRCHDPNHPNYASYGGREIAVCQAWRESFEAFFDHIGPRPSPKHSLDRIDNDHGYEPGNVGWATASEQAQNRRPQLRATCANGHPRTPENLQIVSGGFRGCRICRREQARESARRRRDRKREARTRQNGVEVALGSAGPSQLDALDNLLTTS